MKNKMTCLVMTSKVETIGSRERLNLTVVEDENVRKLVCYDPSLVSQYRDGSPPSKKVVITTEEVDDEIHARTIQLEEEAILLKRNTSL